VALESNSTTNTGCPTGYRTRHFFNNCNTNEDIATKFEQDYVRISPSKSSIWALSKKMETSILISGKITNEMPGSVASGTPYIIIETMHAFRILHNIRVRVQCRQIQVQTKIPRVGASRRKECPLFNHLTPNGHFSGSTAPLTYRCCIFFIYSTDIRTEYFKHAAHSPFFPLQNVVYFIMLPFLVPVLFTF
jgi:hypothetical protein